MVPSFQQLAKQRR
jgi:hypothetical protein